MLLDPISDALHFQLQPFEADEIQICPRRNVFLRRFVTG
ncbi:hypothetical protein NSU_0010 [Novosphingobium pentaromativorans US6-1]|uniref:Uncharacterized protein n=1 Tax=Novosphingobium pentaromativorans US6-1 TaxID=1088721 RepID=G6E6N9_9SPHN|nr:hypothetical protein NSU_0010 [Novosphingobium pentaromativorans US6-1]